MPRSIAYVASGRPAPRYATVGVVVVRTDCAFTSIFGMAYTPDAQTFAAQIASVRQAAGDQPVWAGIGAYRLSPAQTVDNIEAARRLGASGIVLFSYDTIVQPPLGPDYLTRVSRAAFTR